MRWFSVVSTTAALILAGCGGSEQQAREPEGVPAARQMEATEEPAPLTVTSSAFEPGGRIPQRYTGEGDNVSPPLSWKETPEETVEFAIICDDPDAPRKEPWVHWVLYKIPADVTALAEGQRGIGIHGMNSASRMGYHGPMPPPGHGVHHYHFKVHALDRAVELAPGATKDRLLEAMEGHILARGEIVGTYER